MDGSIRRAVKPWARRLGALRALPALAGYRLGRWLVGEPQAFSAAGERIGRLPGMLGVYARYAFARWTLSWCGEDVYIGYNTLLSKSAARLGNRVYIGRHCVIGWATIEDEAMLGDGVQVLSGRHQHGREAAPGQTLQDNPHEFTRVIIGRGAWIGAGAVIMADVGAGAIVGAGAVVTAPVEPATKVAGVPAKPISDSPISIAPVTPKGAATRKRKTPVASKKRGKATKEPAAKSTTRTTAKAGGSKTRTTARRAA